MEVQAREVWFEQGDRTWLLRVPVVFGVIRGSELKKDFIVVQTDGGRLSFHADGAEDDDKVVRAKMHWHSMKKALGNLCFLPRLASRVDLHVTQHRAGGSRSTSSGWVTVDKQTLARFAVPPVKAEEPYSLGRAVAEYLYASPEASLSSDHLVHASLAVVDRRLTDARIRQLDRDRFDSPLWLRFLELRLEE